MVKKCDAKTGVYCISSEKTSYVIAKEGGKYRQIVQAASDFCLLTLIAVYRQYQKITHIHAKGGKLLSVTLHRVFLCHDPGISNEQYNGCLSQQHDAVFIINYVPSLV
ncbi:hypothetical protein NPIL_579231 [Nephila pilipes]|uniref:Uncharacterized protein n=1 Tax=Nephila pilipes TaxID=299642 RepID=A0A8X6QVS7_NEPPI|nr:hypothetical protein NPIL_579231 [Nephila pilipes]